MDPRTYLRFEGFGVLVAALATYYLLGGPLWLLAALALAPDLSMVGYLAGNRVGALVYNAVHVYPLPLALCGTGVWAGAELAVLGGVVWIGHVGADRLFGYGLKDESGFRETHLSSTPATTDISGVE